MMVTNPKAGSLSTRYRQTGRDDSLSDDEDVATACQTVIDNHQFRCAFDQFLGHSNQQPGHLMACSVQLMRLV